MDSGKPSSPKWEASHFDLHYLVFTEILDLFKIENALQHSYMHGKNLFSSLKMMSDVLPPHDMEFTFQYGM